MKGVNMKWFVTVLVLLGSVAAQGGEVEDFVARIKAANPVDRWMESGRLDFTAETDEQVGDTTARYETTGSLLFDAATKTALFECNRTGDPVAGQERGELEEGTTIAHHFLIGVTPDGATLKSVDGDAVQVFGPSWGISFDSVPLLRMGVLPERLLEEAKRIEKIQDGLRVWGQKGTQRTISTDDDGRIVTMIVEWEGNIRRYDLRSYALIAGKAVPKELDFFSDSPKGQKFRRYRLSWSDQTPRADEMTVPIGLDSQVGYSDVGENTRYSRALSKGFLAENSIKFCPTLPPYYCWQPHPDIHGFTLSQPCICYIYCMMYDIIYSLSWRHCHVGACPTAEECTSMPCIVTFARAPCHVLDGEDVCCVQDDEAWWIETNRVTEVVWPG